MRIDDLEFRKGTNFGENLETSYEIVRWQPNKNFKNGPSEMCYSIVWWHKRKEGYELSFIGERPFEAEVDKEVLWDLMEYGANILSAKFELEYDYPEAIDTLYKREQNGKFVKLIPKDEEEE